MNGNSFKTEPVKGVVNGFFSTTSAIAWTALLATAVVMPSWAQSPTVTWNSTVGQLFAVDNQTNMYVNAFGPVVKLDPAGNPIQTNTICPAGGRSQRDAAGNYYFFGNYSPPLDFGGVTLTNGHLFLAKYNSTGSLLWAYPLGPSFAVMGLGVSDLVVAPGGTAYIAYNVRFSAASAYAAMESYSPAGTNNWGQSWWGADGKSYQIRIGGVSETNACALFFYPITTFNNVHLSRFDGVGNESVLASWGQSMDSPPLNPNRYARPILTSSGEIYTVEGSLLVEEGARLTKRSSDGAVIWTTNIGNTTLYWTVGADKFDGVHVADSAGLLRRYDFDGNLVWTLSVNGPVSEMILDAQGNRFITVDANFSARLGPEPLFSVTITNQPLGITVFSGSNVVLNVGASGSGPLRYYWFRNDAFQAGQTNAILSLPDATSAQSGSYKVVVSNFLNSVTSAPALVRVKSVQLFNGSQMLTNGTYAYIAPPTLTIASAFTNGSSFYTLDGSAPIFASTPYIGPFTVSNSATVRAIGYSADFFQSEEADIVNVVLLPTHSLNVTTAGGGSVSLDPPGGIYATSSVVTVAATPAAGWTFLFWTGDVIGSSSTVNVVMDSDKTIQAVFGTTLSTTVNGGGQVQKFPPDALHPSGSVVRLTAIPLPGNYFGVWGNAASGNANPLFFTVTNPNPTVSSLFAPTPAGQAALTVVINGPGAVNVNPPGNVFATNQTVSITATPFRPQGFVSWSGDASGTQNPLSVSMNQERIIIANFTNWPALLVSRASFTSQGLRLTLVSPTQMVFQVQGSTNLNSWVNLGMATNMTGTVEFIDPSGTNLPSQFYRAMP